MENIFTNSQVHWNSLIRTIIFLSFLLASLYGPGQQDIDKKAVKLVNKAMELAKERQFGKAKGLFLQAISRDSSYDKAYEELFIVLKILAQEKTIHDLQQTYVRKVPADKLDTRVWQSLASYEFAAGEYEKARDYLSKDNTPDSILWNSVEFAIAQTTIDKKLPMTELPNQVNRFALQYLPVLTIDKRTLIFTGREDIRSDENVYQSIFSGTSWSIAESISDQINTPYNEGACAISADGRTLVLTSCEGRRSVGNCDLYITRKTGDKWGALKNLGKVVNSRSWDSQPSLSADGTTLYFSSNRPGGVGGKDLWKTDFREGKWSAPENLGEPINTRKNETTPFIHADGSTLFFSSDGHVGMGGYDLYKSEFSEGWCSPENLEYPINTFHDEVSMFVTSDGLEAYFAKEQTENNQLVSSRLVTYKLDHEELVPEINYLTGRVLDKKTNEVLQASIEIVDLDSREILYKTESDQVSGRYFLTLRNDGSFGAFVERAGYLHDELTFSTTSSLSTDTLDFYLQPIEEGASIILKNIYFEIDSDQLNERSDEELAKVIGLMEDNPTMKIEISGHTDNTGSSGYNLDLSKRRAKRVYDFLLAAKVDLWRLSYRGYGDTRPLNKNISEEERSINRRIEFKVVGIK